MKKVENKPWKAFGSMVSRPFLDRSKYWRLSVLKDSEPFPTEEMIFLDREKVRSWEKSWIRAGTSFRPFCDKAKSVNVPTEGEEMTESKASLIVWLSRPRRVREVILLCWAKMSHCLKSGHDSILNSFIAVVLGNNSKFGHDTMEYSLRAGNWEKGTFPKSVKSRELLIDSFWRLGRKGRPDHWATLIELKYETSLKTLKFARNA